MKKICCMIAVFLAVLMMCQNIAMAVYPDSGIITHVQITETGLTIDTASDGEVRLLACAYSPEGRMIWNQIRPASTGRTVFSIPDSVRAKAGSYKAFLTDGSCTPLRQCEVAEVSNLPIRRITCNGQLYKVPTWVENDRIYISTTALESMLGRSNLPCDLIKNGKSLTDAAALMTKSGESFTWDSVLNAAYIWTDLDTLAIVLDETERIKHWGLSQLLPLDNSTITYGEFFPLLDKAVEITAPENLTSWKSSLSDVRASYADRSLTRVEAMFLTFYAAAAMGKDYLEFNTDWLSVNNALGEEFWEELNQLDQRIQYSDILPHIHEPYQLGGFTEAPYVYDGWDVMGVALRYAYGRASSYSGQALFPYDAEHNSMHYGDALTAADALLAVTRLLDSTPLSAEEYIPVTDTESTTPNFGLYAQELMDASKQMPAPTNTQNWHGVTLGQQEYTDYTLNLQQFDQLIRKFSELGFDSARFMLNYETFFDREAKNVNPAALRKLDHIVAMAIRYRLPLVLTTGTLPGRWTSFDHEQNISQGDFSMYHDKDKLEQAKTVWRVLAQRYRDVPNSVLTFTPLWESQNWNLSSGLPHGYEDIPEAQRSKMVADTYEALAREIWKADEKRMILYESTANTPPNLILREARATKEQLTAIGEDRVQLLSNYCETPYVYSEMTGISGTHIDNMNFSTFKPAYPVIEHGISIMLYENHPLTLHNLPEGTEVKFYVDRVDGSGTITLKENGQPILSEKLSGSYNPKEPQFMMRPFATSDKCLSHTVRQESASLAYDYSGSGQLYWCGIEITLPEQYAQERWYFKSDYDIRMGLETNLYAERRPLRTLRLNPIWAEDALNQNSWDEIWVQPEALTYTTDGVAAEASVRSIDIWGKKISQFSPGSALRVESAAFAAGTQLDSALRYYDDTLSMCERYDLGWFVNDGDRMFIPWMQKPEKSIFFAGAITSACEGGYTHRELLQIFQKHMIYSTLE